MRRTWRTKCFRCKLQLLVLLVGILVMLTGLVSRGSSQVLPNTHPGVSNTTSSLRYVVALDNERITGVEKRLDKIDNLNLPGFIASCNAKVDIAMKVLYCIFSGLVSLLIKDFLTIWRRSSPENKPTKN